MLHLIVEDNSDLKNRVFPIPDGVRKILQKTLNNYNGDKTVDGYKRLNNLLSAENISYRELKRIKNFFDNYGGTDKSVEYILNGGDSMKTWVNDVLGVATQTVHNIKQAKKDAGISNAFIKPHEKDRQTKRKNKPTYAKFDTKNANQKMFNNNILKYENVLRESIDWEDYIYDYSPYYVLENFWETRNGTQNWGVLINPSMYQKALDDFTKNGKLMSFPTKYIYQWIGIIIKNTVILNSNTELAGHSGYFPTDDFLAFVENHFPEKLDEIDTIDEYSFLDELGLYDWMKMPDGSDAWSDFGLKPINDILMEYNDESTPEETLVLINRVLDVYHQRGDLSSIFIQGGSKSLSQISNSGFTANDGVHATFESIVHKKNKENKTIFITEQQAKMIKEAMDGTFDLDELSELPSYRSRFEYCRKHLGRHIGKGSSRATFQIDDEKVLKLAWNEKGVAQNEAEYNAYGNDIFPEVYECDLNGYWMISEFVLPARTKDFKECFNMSFNEFVSFIYACGAYRFRDRRFLWGAMDEEKYVELLDNNEDLCSFDEYIGNYGKIVIGDMTRITNYGLTKRNGQPHIVLLDSGLTDEVWDNYYKRY